MPYINILMSAITHDDVIKWKHFPRYWSCVRGIHRSPGDFLSQRPVTRGFDVFFDLRLNQQLSKQSWGWWFEIIELILTSLLWHEWIINISIWKWNRHTVWIPLPEVKLTCNLIWINHEMKNKLFRLTAAKNKSSDNWPFVIRNHRWSRGSRHKQPAIWKTSQYHYAVDVGRLGIMW